MRSCRSWRGPWCRRADRCRARRCCGGLALGAAGVRASPRCGARWTTEPGADAEHATVRTRRRSAASGTAHSSTLRRSRQAPLLGRPSVLPDRKTHADRELTRAAGRLLLPRAHRGHSPRKTACRLSSAHHRRAPSSASRQRGFFVGARTCVRRRNIHNGSQRRDRQGQGDPRCLRTTGQMS